MATLIDRVFRDTNYEILKNKPGLKKKFTRLFQAKTPDELHDFHAKCDGKGPTLTVLHGKGNVLFGGYTCRDWASGDLVKKTDKYAFLFHMNENMNASCKFFPISQNYSHRAITCGTNLGPTFGGGVFFWQDCDLKTFDLSKWKKPEMKDGFLCLNGTLNFDFAYKSQEKPFQNSDINGGTLCVKMLEVYLVEDDDWRENPEESVVNMMKDFLLRFETLRGSNIPKYNILLLGVTASGKSSFYNTLATAISGTVVDAAVIGESVHGSVTNKVHVYKVLSRNKDEVNVTIYDIRGFDTKRTFDKELEFLLEGKLSKDYKFPATIESHPEITNENPALKDRIHLVCFVFDVTRTKMCSDDMERIRKGIMQIVREQDIPLVCVATKFDQLCLRIHDDVENIYRSPEAFNAVKHIAKSLGLEEKHVFPIVNYVNDRLISPAKDVLAIQALYSMIKLVEDNLKVKDLVNTGDTWTERFHHFSASKQETASISVEEVHAEVVNIVNTRLNVLCVGPKGSGKSSFIDSINSTLTRVVRHDVAGRLVTDDRAPESRTQRFQLFPINDELYTNVRFGDMPGFQENGGIELHHVQTTIEGNIPDRFRFQGGDRRDNFQNVGTPNSVSDLETRMHCVCLVFDISSVDTLPLKIQQSCTGLIKWLSDNDIPFVVVITKGDKLSSAVHDNILEIFSDWRIRKNKNLLIKMLGIKETIVFPIRNYVHEAHVVKEMDDFLIEAFREILRVGEYYKKRLRSGN